MRSSRVFAQAALAGVIALAVWQPPAIAAGRKPAIGHGASMQPATMLAANLPAATMVATSPVTPATTENEVTRLIVDAGSGRVITLPGPVTNVFVSDPKIAEVRPASPTSLFLFGVTAGRTTVAALDSAGHAVRQFEVTVRPTSFGAREAAGAINANNPGANVRIEAQPKKLLITGTVPSAAAAVSASATAAGYTVDGQVVDNQTRISSQIQVGLRVRIAEMSRTVTRNLGINWQALGELGSIGKVVALVGSSGLNASAAATVACAAAGAAGAATSSGCPGLGFNAVLDALAQDNLIHMLAEPNLTTMSGETASFLVGGEFPIPVAQQQGSVSVEFKQFGIGLAFVPTVLGEDRIRLHVRPEVSQLSTQGAVTINGTTIPALTVRRADTTVEMGSGQSFAIAGLLSDQTNHSGNAIPELGEIPILGALFRSDKFQRLETELVIIVTPYIVRPVNDPNALKLPTDGFKVPNDIERLLLMRQTGRVTTEAQRVPGQAGFVVE